MEVARYVSLHNSPPLTWSLAHKFSKDLGEGYGGDVFSLVLKSVHKYQGTMQCTLFPAISHNAYAEVCHQAIIERLCSVHIYKRTNTLMALKAVED